MSYRASRSHSNTLLHKSIEEDRGLEHTDQPTTPRNSEWLISESESIAPLRDGRTDNFRQPPDDSHKCSSRHRIARSEDSAEDGEPKPVKTPKQSNAHPESTVRSKDREVKKSIRPPYVPRVRKRKPTADESTDSSDDGKPTPKKPRKGSLAREEVDRDSVMREVRCHAQKLHEVESHETLSDMEISEQEDEESLIRDHDEDLAALSIPDINPDEGLAQAVPIESLPRWEDTDVDIDVGEVLPEKGYDEKDIPREDKIVEAIGTAERPIDLEMGSEHYGIDNRIDDDDDEGRAQRAFVCLFLESGTSLLTCLQHLARKAARYKGFGTEGSR